VTLSLINRNTRRRRNDFAIDDVFLGTTSTVTPVPEPETYALMLAASAPGHDRAPPPQGWVLAPSGRAAGPLAARAAR
jgi:hypothetical protein